MNVIFMACHKHFIALAAVLLLLVSNVMAETVSEDPREREMLVIAGKLRCAVCQNQPVSESHSGLATDMRAIIREQLAQGRTEQEIIDYFVDRYGDYVLLKPRTEGIGLPLWLLPPILLLLVGTFAWAVMRQRSQSGSQPTASLSEEDRERIRRARRDQGAKNEEEDK